MKSWRTTLLGIVTAVYMAVEPIVTTGEIDYERLIWAAIIAIFGYVVKDFNVSGKP